jgi:hypothetical protein
MEAHHRFACPSPFHDHGHHLFQGEGAGADAFARRWGEGRNLRIDEGVGPNEHIGLLDRLGRPQGE